MAWLDGEGGDLSTYRAVCRNVKVAGRRTSLRMEPVFWSALYDITNRERVTLNDLITRIDARRGRMNLTAAVRVFTVHYHRAATPDAAAPVELLETVLDKDLDETTALAGGAVGAVLTRRVVRFSLWTAGRPGRILAVLPPVRSGDSP